MTMIRRLGAVAIAFCAFTTPVYAEYITIGLAAEPSSMDPYFHNLGPNNALIGHMFERLVEFDANQQLIPGLAT